jgi:homoserine dehydrogenase
MLTARQLELRHRCGFGISTVAVTDSAGSVVDNHGLNLKEVLARKTRTGTVGPRTEPDDRLEIIRREDADVVVELTPGNHSTGQPGSSHFEAALRSGKHLVTANKTTLALDYPRFLRVARDQGLKLMYGACVGGGVPILDFGESCSAAEPITKIEGVLNTTSNFILTEIEGNGRTFREALKEAQSLGYTEADPSLDIDGFDSACKIVIIANHVFGTSFRLRDVNPIAGIRRITEAQVKETGTRGYRIRMIALAERHLEVMVTTVPWRDELAVEGPSYAVRFHCKYSGTRTVSGMGAGGKTTSIAVLRDIIALGKSLLD